MVIVEHIQADGSVKATYQINEGMSLNDTTKIICPETDGKFSLPVIALVGSKPAVRELGDWDIALSEGTHVQFRELAMGGGGGGGGGKNPLQTVMQLAVIAIATAATWYIGGAGGLAVGGWFAAGSASAYILAGVVGAGIMMAGSMLMGALFQNRPNMPSGHWSSSNAASASPTYNINSSGNQARLYQPEPELFGRMKIVPDFCAQTWMQYSGNDQYGYFVYAVGRGEYDIESLQFGETVFWRNGSIVSNSGYEIQGVQIVPPGGKVTLFPDNVITSNEVSGQELFAPNQDEYNGAVGPYGTNPPGTSADRLYFDFILQSGIGYYDDRGKLQEYSVSWVIEYQRVDDFGNAISGWSTLGSLNYSGATLTPQRMTRVYSVSGRFIVRCRRTSETRGDGRTMDRLVWGAMRAMLPGTYTYPITCVAFSVKANNALTQNASRMFSIVATRRLPIYNRTTKRWSSAQPTRSWAAAVSSVLRCSWGGNLDDANIDLDTLWAIDERLRAKGWNYDAYIDSPYLVWTLLCEMCQSQCVLPRVVGPIISFAEDKRDRTPTFALTPRNIVRNSFSVNYVSWSDSTPDDVVIDYLDADYGFQQRDVTASLPESESKEPSSLSILGITNRNHAHKVAVAYAAHNRWQRVVVDCQVENLGRIINRGDICTVAHPRFKNTAAGAVEDWNESTLEVTLKYDMRKTPESSINEYWISFTRQDGSIWGPCKVSTINGNVIRLNSSDYSTLLLQQQGNPFEWFVGLNSDCQPTTWTMYLAKLYQRPMIVTSISSSDANHYNLKLMNYDDRIYQYENIAVPAWQGRGQLPTATASLSVPSGLRGSVNAEGQVVLTWLTVSRADWYDVETSTDNRNWIAQGRANINMAVVSVPTGVYYARVRSANNEQQSDWATCHGSTADVAPNTPTNLSATTYRSAASTVTWDAADRATSYKVSLLHDKASFYTANVTSTEFKITPEVQTGGPYRNITVSVVAVGAGGSSSPVSIDLSDPAPQEISDARLTLKQNNLTLESVTPLPSDDDWTGYIVVKGDNESFTASQVLEMRQINSLPYVWTGLNVGKNYFRIASRDRYFETSRNLLDLNWSAVLIVDVQKQIQPPSQPSEMSSSSYIDGTATISWQNVENATSYDVSVLSDNTSVYSTNVTTNSFTLTPNMQEGGPYRRLTIAVTANGEGGTSSPTEIYLNDFVPQKITEVTYSVQ